jgi:uncharacterized membrane protein YfcA
VQAQGECMLFTIIVVTILSLISNIVGTVSGFGVGTILTPALLFFLPFDQTILLVCILHLFHDIGKISFFRHGIDWKLFFHFGVPTIIASLLGALLVTPEQSTQLAPLLGIFLIASVGALYATDYVIFPSNWITSVIGGLISGFFAGIFGIRGAVRSVFLSAFDLSKERYIATTGAISLVLDITRLGAYYFNRIELPTYFYWGLFIFVPVSFVGVYVGQLIVTRISQQTFDLIVAIFLLIVGVRFLLTPWF